MPLVKCVIPLAVVRQANVKWRLINSNRYYSLPKKAQTVTSEVKEAIDNRDLTFYLTQNFQNTDWSENVERSFLEGKQAVVVVDSFRLHKLEAICKATMQWIAEYPHPLFELTSMRIEFNTGETFAARYVTNEPCDFELR